MGSKTEHGSFTGGSIEYERGREGRRGGRVQNAICYSTGKYDCRGRTLSSSIDTGGWVEKLDGSKMDYFSTVIFIPRWWKMILPAIVLLYLLSLTPHPCVKLNFPKNLSLFLSLSLSLSLFLSLSVSLSVSLSLSLSLSLSIYISNCNVRKQNLGELFAPRIRRETRDRVSSAIVEILWCLRSNRESKICKSCTYDSQGESNEEQNLVHRRKVTSIRFLDSIQFEGGGGSRCGISSRSIRPVVTSSSRCPRFNNEPVSITSDRSAPSTPLLRFLTR